uniref:E1 ubiquitin-activating enzyme n=1 Tax=Erpetoichthys calabaricus TaxID=27687 RepID=A0A8C4TL28_ERPCA
MALFKLDLAALYNSPLPDLKAEFRQRYVLGDSAMQQMAQSHFLDAKNIVLAGVKALTVHDTKKCETWDLGTNFFIREEDILTQRSRVEAVYSHIAELNPYVQVNISAASLDENTDLSFLKQFQCVILTDTRISLQKKINDFCRLQQPPIKFISSDVYGICARIFCDFGDQFEVSDPNGEEVKEIFVQSITKANPGIVTCLENRTHGLQSGQTVTFKEINGMSELNGNTHQIEVLSPYSFSIGDTSDLEDYTHGGIVCQIKTPKTVCFCLCSKGSFLLIFQAPLQLHAAFLALSKFQEQHQRMPRIGWLSRSARGSLPPLAAAVGGIASQEVLKALTGKFSPLQQWVYIIIIFFFNIFVCRGDRYDALRACVGRSCVGCGAIGCEMLKNFALLGVSLSGKSGEIIITDPDLIEKSNLNRQFLFRPHHIQKPKSTTAAAATLEINPQVKISARLNKVCPATENIYSDEFYSKLDVVVTALDNVEARRYIDSRSVSNQRPLLDSGTMGTKGHTEVIVPNLTESYNSHRDPPEEEIPFCTLKSFPAVIEHTIQWARDKFESLFTHKPSIYNKFWQTHSSAEQVLQVKYLESLEGSFQVIKLLSRRPAQWEDCVLLARFKFEKYFKRKKIETDENAKKPDHIKLNVSSEEEREAINLLERAISNNIHLQTTPILFEKDDDSNGHIDFITAASNLRARMYSIESADRFRTKRIAGKIIPAIATATAAVSGLVRIVAGYGFDSFRNCFFNLALPIIVFTKPAEVRRTQIRTNLLTFSLKLAMQKLIKPSSEKKYVDLTVSFPPESDGDEDLPGPPVRYHFSQEDN